MRSKKGWKAVAALLILTCGLSGCAEKAGQGVSEKEVLTLTKIPDDKLLITVCMGDGMNFEAMEKAIEENISGVDIVIRRNTPVGMAANNHDSEDITLSSGSEYAAINLEDAFIDLSGEVYIQNYYLSTLQAGEVNGKLYYLPGPSNIYGIVYNKGMFRENGWTVPGNLDEFIHLCTEIERSGIRAIQPALYYADAASQFFTGFTYRTILDGVENQKWLSDFHSGNAGMTGHMEPAFDTMDRLMEAGILRPGDFEVQPGTRSDMMYKEKTCAMILETQAAVEYAEKRAGADAPELGIMPFFSSAEEDSDYFLSVPVYNVAANKKLEDKGNEKKLEKVKEILEYLSTAKGQKEVMGGNSSVISSVKGIEEKENEFLNEAIDTIEKGHVVSQPYFVGFGSNEFTRVLKEGLKLYTEGGIQKEKLMAKLDEARDSVLQNEKESGITKIGSAQETFTVLQTAILLGEIFKEKTDAQIGLCAANTRAFGSNWKIYKGDIYYGGQYTIDHNMNISFLQEKKEGETVGKLIKVKMTGENILRALNSLGEKTDRFPDAYFTAAGLKITFAPWAGEGRRYVSVKLPDGKELNPDEVYTVALWNGSVSQELIESVEEEYEDSAADLLKDWIEDKGGSIRPDNKNFVLDWGTVEE